jgi:hypothetical protein
MEGSGYDTGCCSTESENRINVLSYRGEELVPALPMAGSSIPAQDVHFKWDCGQSRSGPYILEDLNDQSAIMVNVAR